MAERHFFGYIELQAIKLYTNISIYHIAVG